MKIDTEAETGIIMGKKKKKKKGRERERAWIIDCRNGNQHVTDAPSNTKLTDK